jgi:hypothetical protein
MFLMILAKSSVSATVLLIDLLPDSDKMVTPNVIISNNRLFAILAIPK